MGRFRVMVFAREWTPGPGEPPLRLLAYRLPTAAATTPTP
jgi:hypothetical protein